MHVVITGASSGIGEALARRYVAKGASVTLVARRRALLDDLATELRGSRPESSTASIFVAVADLASPPTATRFLADAEAALGPVDLLINNAGVQIVAALADVDPAEGERLVALNLLTPLRLCHAVLPGMLARGHGAIVNIASVAALVPTPGMAHYCASKAAIAAASETLRGELRGTGVTVVTVYPGPVDTPMMRAAVDVLSESSSVASRLPTGRTDVLAELIDKAVTCRKARVIYPRIYGASRWLTPLATPLTAMFTPKPSRAKS